VVEVQRLNESGRWEILEFTAGQTVELTALGISLGVDELYRDSLSA
jgi:hypothetical protein